ncbi:MAG: N-acetylmuramoyl-L-alanine amidase, partial [Planctomycetota bacterium]|nr:N-acetylmuramoyl-L-alanine amidase [Planctomycetota bacterium]
MTVRKSVLVILCFLLMSGLLLAQTNTSTPPQPPGALGDPNNELGGGALARKKVYVSPGHGNYWHTSLGWIYQRPDCYGLIEDIHNNEIVVSYLQRYLYNAGATAFNCRERSTQLGHVVVDSTPEQGAPEYTEPQGAWTTTTSTGLGYNGGRYRYAYTDVGGTTAMARWSPTISTAGFYSVWVWYYSSTNRANNALYRITHSGGTTEVRIDQSGMSSRWVWLGEFHFSTQNAATATQFAELSNYCPGQAGKVVIADAVRIGAGNGSIVRGGTTSNKLRSLEASRYWLEYVGAPSSVYNYYSTGEDNSDDVVCRPLYADWQGGDLYLSIHTNAGGGTGTDTFIHDTSPSPGSADLRRRVHRSVIEHVRNTNGYNYPSWVDRGEKEANFGEVREVDTMPATLIELAFHDKQTPDNDFLHEDEFRHLVARSLYKGIVKYFADADGAGGIEAVYVPLPPRNFRVRNIGGGTVRLDWDSTPDNIVGASWPGWDWVAAAPDRYKVYRSTNGMGFDNGSTTTNSFLEINGLPVNTVYYFRVT